MMHAKRRLIFWVGKTQDGTDVSGSIKIPECAYDTEPDDYVVATGETHSVKEFVEVAFSRAGLDYRDYVKTDPDLFRPAEVNILLGDATKAQQRLGWNHKTGFRELVWEMVDTDCKSAGVALPAPLAFTARQ